MILTDDRQSNICIENNLVETIDRVIDFALKIENMQEDYEVSIIFVDNQSIKKLNNDFRHIDKETDVLSFPMLEYPEGKVYKEVYNNVHLDDSFYDDERLVLGDIALSLEKALEQSKEYGHSFEREVTYLTVHSVLHLLGYDHMEESDKVIMRNREEEILRNFNLQR